MSNLLYPQEAACLVRIVEACDFVAEAMYMTTHFVGNRTASIEWRSGARFVVRLWNGSTTFEVFETLAAMKAAYAID